MGPHLVSNPPFFIISLKFRILLRYIPITFLTLSYMLLYFQMEHLFIVSKIQGSNMLQNQMSQKQLAFTIKIISWVVTVLFTLI
jgi:hypothetical protein